MRLVGTVSVLSLALVTAACGDTSSDGGGAAGGAAASSSSTGTPAPCGSRSGMRSLTMRSLDLGGGTRTYEVYLPAKLDATKPVPLVLVHHGYIMSGDDMRLITHFTDLADSEGFGVVFPDGEGGPDTISAPWNVGLDICPSKAGITPDAEGDDFAFLDAIKADVALDQCLDTGHLFITGFSMGGYFTHHAACMRSDFRAAAPHSGGTHDLASCTDGHIPMIILHGTGDTVIPDGCDDPAASDIPKGVTPSALAWAAHNGCKQTASTKISVKNGTCQLFDGCPEDGQVELCTFDAMDHCWAGGPNVDGTPAECTDYEDATGLVWAFWKKYAW